ncbi:MAG: DUF45 domain-containing protein [Candidatus Micrarchaeota archaeon]|nr:DUF45 domain-containing protein [Candidatus Micrarchaeota archaeon]MDE1847358.1 DUF45 domain-containing protein [Candidatus Micrarchaeota archaeon]MDE1863973.1 DUF45 domain-containing protein [Candidatus Micrarchaeota archaeon]
MEKNITTEHGEIKYSVVRGRRKSISLRFHDSSTLLISIPRYSLVNIERLIRKHMDWITEHSSEMASSMHFIKDGKVLQGGSYLQVKLVERKCRPMVTVVDGIMIVEAPDKISCFNAINKFAQKKTEERASQIAQLKMEQAGRSASIRFRRMRKWGYCTTDKRITFNSQLSMLPAEIMEYVVSHEVAHLSHMNHSRKFWEAVSTMCPDHKLRKKALRAYSTSDAGADFQKLGPAFIPEAQNA